MIGLSSARHDRPMRGRRPVVVGPRLGRGALLAELGDVGARHERLVARAGDHDAPARRGRRCSAPQRAGQRLRISSDSALRFAGLLKVTVGDAVVDVDEELARCRCRARPRVDPTRSTLAPAEIVDVVGDEAELGEHLVGVLPGRRAGACARWAARRSSSPRCAGSSSGPSVGCSTVGDHAEVLTCGSANTSSMA